MAKTTFELEQEIVTLKAQLDLASVEAYSKDLRVAGLERELAELRKGPVIPKGYAIVPLDPTPEMLDAYKDFYRAGLGLMDVSIYKAMIEAAPPAASVAQASKEQGQ